MLEPCTNCNQYKPLTVGEIREPINCKEWCQSCGKCPLNQYSEGNLEED